jgi:ABC-type uncharacterized transport system substrate-binding protein
MIRRREFITLLGGATAAWPLTARAQGQKCVGMLMYGSSNESDGQSFVATFVQGMRKIGWVDGQNLRLEVRWSAGDPSLVQAYAHDLVDLLRPDVLLAASTANLIALRRATDTIPIVFLEVSDPVAGGFVPSLTRPGGNITGFANPEFSIANKWADLLKQMVPGLARVAIIYNPNISPQSRLHINALEAAAPSLGLEVMEAPVQSAGEIEGAVTRLSRTPNVGLIVPPDSFTRLNSKLLIDAAARNRLPAIYAHRAFIAGGGLMYYFGDQSEQFRQAPFYVDRILKGTKPGDLPVLLPTKFNFIVNRGTAKALGIEVPLGLLLAADEVIE